MNGAVGVVVAPRGRLLMVLGFTITGGKIVKIDAIADPAALQQLELVVLDDCYENIPSSRHSGE